MIEQIPTASTENNHPIYNTISLSRHEQVCLMRLRFERYFSHHRAMYYILFTSYLCLSV